MDFVTQLSYLARRTSSQSEVLCGQIPALDNTGKMPVLCILGNGRWRYSVAQFFEMELIDAATIGL